MRCVMNKTYFLLLFITLLLTASHTQAQTQGQNLGTLTLQECIEIAQEQSPVAQAARYQLIANQWQYRSYRADLLPSLTLRGDAPNYNKSISTNVLDNGDIVFTSRNQSDATAELSVEQNIGLTGGNLSLSSGLTRLGIFEGEGNYMWQSRPLVASFNQPLFQFNSLQWANRIEPLQFEIAQKEYVQQMEGIAVDVTNRFFQVYLNRINLENAEFNVAKNDSIYQISQGRYNVGSISENDLLQTELQLSNSESELIRAEIEYDRSRNDFKIYLGYSTDATFELEEPEDLPEIDVNIARARELAIENNSEALTYQLDELIADRTYAQAKAQSNFQVDINASYGLNQVSTEFEDLYTNPQNRQFFTVGFEVPIFNWGKQRAEVNMARNQQRSVANNIEFQRRQFVQEVEYTVSQFLQLRGQVLRAAQSDDIAQRRYDSAQNRYLVGTITITDLFIAQQDRDAARQSYVAALQNFWSGWYNLRQLTLYDFRNDQPITYSLQN